ncbi:MAG TPA: TIGR02679 family protein [Solirubrobacteraceae bacterium]|nr:TIGR02679 family protein [Solirubrobacteraceae bacterium]
MTALDEPALQRLWSQARRAWQRRGAAGDATIHIARLGHVEAAAIAGLPWPGRHRPVLPGDDLRRPLSHLEAALREIGEELLAVLERHGGPVEDPRAERRAARAARADLFESLEQMIDASGHPELHAWLAGARLRPGDEARARLALSVVVGLPSAETVDRAALAARRCSGDSHALDPGTALERLVRRLLQQLDGCPDADLGALEVRRLYERFGVEPDPTSSVVLTLGLPGEPGSVCGRVLTASAGRHAVLSYGLLRDEPPRWPGGLRVFVCENPTVVHAAERALGGSCAPLVCTAGWPGSAAQLLLASLRDSGAQLLHHADFDDDGIAMHDHLARTYGAVPWRFDAAAYGAAAARAGPRAGAREPRLAAAGLAATHAQLGIRVVEELLLDELLRDLGDAAACI